jgi:uncharacterized protein YndB with AHSA1/START domain
MPEDQPTRVVLERVLPATPADVFSAWTTADVLEKFMCPGDVTRTHVDVDARVGGRFRIVMRAVGRDLDHRGEYRVLEPGRRIVFTWASAATGGGDTLVTIELAPHEDGTRMVLIHERLPDADALRSHERGWTTIAWKLARHLSTEVSDARSAVR